MPENYEKDLNTTPFVFVYGSLKRGHWNHSILNNTPFVSEGLTVRKDLFLHDCGFPYMIEGGNGSIYGELYEVDNVDVIQSLDWLEGVDSGHYQREIIEVYNLADNSTVLAWSYFAQQHNYPRIQELPLCSYSEGCYTWQ